MLKEMGFKWRKYGSKRKLLIERPDIENLRSQYLREIRKQRRANKKIFYLDKTWMDSNLTLISEMLAKPWGGLSLSDLNPSNRVIVLDIGSEDGFLQGGRLYKANTTIGDYHSQMNFVNFTKWIRERVLPSLPPNSVVIIDNAPFRGEQGDKVPNKSATKKVMIEWLLRHGEEYNEKSTRKTELFEAIQRLKPPNKVYKIIDC